jgi:hypothetical protein
MDGDERLTFHIVFQGGFDPVADFMSLGNACATGYDEMESMNVMRPAWRMRTSCASMAPVACCAINSFAG